MFNTKIYCRFCAEEKQQSQVIDLKNDTETYNNVLSELSPFPVDFSDLTKHSSLPKCICLVCRNALNYAHTFLLKMQKSQDILSVVLGLKKVKDESESLTDSTEDSDDDFNDDMSVKNEPAVVYNVSESVLDLDSAKDSTAADDKLVVTSWLDYPWACAKCDIKVSSLPQLREHCAEQHSECFSAQCADCSKYIPNFNTFTAHAMNHREELRLFCKYCNYKSHNVKEAKSHTKKHNDTESLCYKCGKSVTLHSNLTKYCLNSSKITWKSCDWICGICGEVTTSVGQLRKHCRKDHNKCFIASCVDCGSKIETFVEYVMHLRKHLPVLKRHCYDCNEDLGKMKREPKHFFENHQKDDQVACPTCGVILPNKARLKRHIKEVNKIPSQPRKKMPKPTAEDLTCKICNKVLKYKESFRAHLEIHKEDRKKVYCDRCGKEFLSKSSCRVHIATSHDGKPDFTCEICQKQFLSAVYLKHHIVTHNPEKPFSCEVCSKTFKQKKHLKLHSVIHSDDTRYQCSFCEKKFKQYSVWKTHLNQHTGEKPYVCTECPMKFSNWPNCNKHMKRKHGLTLSKTVLTPIGRLPVNLKPAKEIKTVKDYEETKEWADNFVAALKGEVPSQFNVPNYGESHYSNQSVSNSVDLQYSSQSVGDSREPQYSNQSIDNSSETVME